MQIICQRCRTFQSPQTGEARRNDATWDLPCGICKAWHLTSKKGATPKWARHILGNV